MMRPQSALHYTATIERISEDLVTLLHTARGEEGEVEDVLDLVFRWALESITSVFLDTRLGCLEAEPGQESIRLIENANTVGGPAMWKLVTRPPLWKYFQSANFK